MLAGLKMAVVAYRFWTQYKMCGVLMDVFKRHQEYALASKARERLLSVKDSIVASDGAPRYKELLDHVDA